MESVRKILELKKRLCITILVLTEVKVVVLKTVFKFEKFVLKFEEVKSCSRSQKGR